MIYYNFKQMQDRLLESLRDDLICVDATIGNGHDTLKFLKKFKNGFVYGFDIQEIAIKNTEKLLQENDFSNYKLILDGHENIDNYVKKADLIMFNTGYLPKSDKKIKTNKETTLKALEKSISILNNNGIIFFVQYIGHEGSFEEAQVVDEFFKSLNQKNYRVIKTQFFNQINNPPIIYIGEKYE